MEPFDLVHNIKAEKADAVARYTPFTKIVKAVKLIEAFIAVALIFKFSGEYLLALTSYLMNQHVVFLVGNVIAFVCYLLSRYSDSGSLGIHYDNSKDETVSDFPKVKLVPLQSTEPPTECGNQIFANEKAMTVLEPDVAAAKQIERFQRTQLDLKSNTSVKHQAELRWSVTERRPTENSFPAVDKLSNEEFRIVVEAFILKQ